jgi:hypothetical protein
VDEIMSGLNALLAQSDDPRPSKIIEARQAERRREDPSSGIRQINQRREVYGFTAVKAA